MPELYVPINKIKEKYEMVNDPENIKENLNEKLNYSNHTSDWYNFKWKNGNGKLIFMK
jgi:hypothetical protein